MDYKKKLSIIIPVYKTEKYLTKCLDSVLDAVDQNTEVLVINDGSPDHSEEIILQYVKQYPNIFVYYKKENGGLSDVKNYGLERISGEYVIFLDSDDFIEPEMYREMLKVAEQEKADVVTCDIYMDYENGAPQGVVYCTSSIKSSIYHRVLDTWLMPASWNKLVKSELYKGLEFPKGLNNEDVCVTPVVLARAKKISVINKPFYHYLQRAGSIQNSAFSEKRFVILDTVKLALQRMSDMDEEKQRILKDTLYLHQVLAIAMYPIREIENIQERERMLTSFMERVFTLFPDFMEARSFKNLVRWGNPLMRTYRKKSLKLLGERKYAEVCRYWEKCNKMFNLARRLGFYKG